MIVNWEREFSKKLVLDGIDLEDNVGDLDRSVNMISGNVREDDNEYLVIIELDDDFKIKSLECECGKKKCPHMTALLHANNFKFKKDIEYNLLVDEVEEDKLVEFVKEQVMFNEDFLEDFKDKFRQDLLNDSEIPLDDKLFLIFDYYKWQSLIGDFIKKDLMKLYEDGYYSETYYLISVMFKKILSDVTYNPESELEKSYMILIDLIDKLSGLKHDLIESFITHCINHNYLSTYPPFEKLLKRIK